MAPRTTGTITATRLMLRDELVETTGEDVVVEGTVVVVGGDVDIDVVVELTVEVVVVVGTIGLMEVVVDKEVKIVVKDDDVVKVTIAAGVLCPTVIITGDGVVAIAFDADVAAAAVAFGVEAAALVAAAVAAALVTTAVVAALVTAAVVTALVAATVVAALVAAAVVPPAHFPLPSVNPVLQDSHTALLAEHKAQFASTQLAHAPEED